ncbi:hypothetical protein HID58_079902, partial [Brassica napus]
LHNMLDGEANQTAVRKLIQECYMEDSSGRSLGLLSHKLNVFRRKVIDPLTTVKARVKNDGVANALIQHQWRPKSFITDLAVSTSKSPKADFGMASGDIVVDAHQKELERVISKVKVDIHGSFVSMSSSVHP